MGDKGRGTGDHGGGEGSDFRDRVMDAINDPGGEGRDDVAEAISIKDDELDGDAPTSPFAGTERGGQHVPAQTEREEPDEPEELQPTPPGVDDLGEVLVPFNCCKCGTLDHAPAHTVEIYRRRRIECLPCRAPWRWRWKRDDDGGRFLAPTPGGGKPRSRLGEPERAVLENLATELLDLKLRRDFLIATLLKVQAELNTLEPRVVTLTLVEVPAAQAAVEAIELDPNLEKRQEAADLAHQITLMLAAARKAKQAAAVAEQRKRRA